MIAAGTAIQTLHERDLCAIEGLKAAYSTLFTNPAGWPGFRERAQVHPLRSMVAALSQDALALVVIAH